MNSAIRAQESKSANDFTILSKLSASMNVYDEYDKANLNVVNR